MAELSRRSVILAVGGSAASAAAAGVVLMRARGSDGPSRGRGDRTSFGSVALRGVVPPGAGPVRHGPARPGARPRRVRRPGGQRRARCVDGRRRGRRRGAQRTAARHGAVAGTVPGPGRRRRADGDPLQLGPGSRTRRTGLDHDHADQVPRAPSGPRAVPGVRRRGRGRADPARPTRCAPSRTRSDHERAHPRREVLQVAGGAAVVAGVGGLVDAPAGSRGSGGRGPHSRGPRPVRQRGPRPHGRRQPRLHARVRRHPDRHRRAQPEPAHQPAGVPGRRPAGEQPQLPAGRCPARGGTARPPGAAPGPAGAVPDQARVLGELLPRPDHRRGDRQHGAAARAQPAAADHTSCASTVWPAPGRSPRAPRPSCPSWRRPRAPTPTTTRAAGRSSGSSVCTGCSSWSRPRTSGGSHRGSPSSSGSGSGCARTSTRCGAPGRAPAR